MADAPFRSVTVVGFGLIGASLSLALKGRDPGVRVTAVDTAETLRTAAVSAIADACCDVADEHAVGRAMQDTELTVLAAPIRAIEAHLELALKSSPVVTDCGSTKRTIVERARSFSRHAHFVPGHPMAGRPQGGAGSAVAELFEQRRWILCPEGVDAQALARVERLVRYIGADCVQMNAADHDRAVAVTSHAPQVFASLLTVMAHRLQAEKAAGPGYLSATRVAGGNISMWRDIFSSNADALSDVILDLADELARAGRALRSNDVEQVIQVLKTAQELRVGSKPDA